MIPISKNSKQFKMLYNLFVIFLSIISHVNGESFCDREHIDKLFDLIFNYDNFAYVFRGTDAWILNYDNRTKRWREEQPIARKSLFEGLPDDVSVKTIFSISKYDVCGGDVCDQPSDAFNPTGVTFVLGPKNFWLYKRLDVANFTQIVTNDTNVPWEAVYEMNSTEELFDVLKNETIEATLYRPPMGSDTDRLFFITNETIHSYSITPLPQDRHVTEKRVRPSELANITIIGWIFQELDTLAFGDNNVWQLRPVSTNPENKVCFIMYKSVLKLSSVFRTSLSGSLLIVTIYDPLIQR